jgi:hypothetical protein
VHALSLCPRACALSPALSLSVSLLRALRFSLSYAHTFFFERTTMHVEFFWTNVHNQR